MREKNETLRAVCFVLRINLLVSNISREGDVYSRIFGDISYFPPDIGRYILFLAGNSVKYPVFGGLPSLVLWPLPDI